MSINIIRTPKRRNRLSAYLDDDLLLNAVGAVESLDDVIGAAVLEDGSPHFNFPFKHADHKISVE